MEGKTPTEIAQYWITELSLSQKDRDAWLAKAKKVVKRYRDERSGKSGARQNVLWANTQTLGPMLYSQMPKPVVERRAKTKDPIVRLACQALERATTYSTDCHGFEDVLKDCRDDWQLAGFAVARERYVPHYGPPTQDPQSGQEFTPVVYEESITDYIHWQDFAWSPCRRWGEVRWIGIKNYMLKDETGKRFGKEFADKLQYDYFPEGLTDDQKADPKVQDMSGKAVIWEIWNKADKKVYFISDKCEVPLDEVDDPLGLKNFFPCPRPMFGTKTTDTMVPVPDFCEWQDLATELDTITRKIHVLEKSLRVVGVYDKTMAVLGRMLKENVEFELLPEENWPQLAQQGGLKNLIEWFPLDFIAKALLGLYEARDKTMASIYEITGWSDIMRGATDPGETATAQQIKGNFATLRVADKQREMQRFIKDIIAIKAEIIAEHFDPNTLGQIVGEDLSRDQNFAAAVQLLKNEELRGYKIDIETDSTIAVDENTQKQTVNEFMGALGQFLGEFAQFTQATPDFNEALAETLLWAIRHYRAGRQVEGAFENAIEMARQRSEQAKQQPPQPDPEMIKMQQQQQMEQGRMQMEGQKLQLEAAKVETERSKVASDAQFKQQSLAIDYQKAQMDAALKLKELQTNTLLEAAKAEQAIQDQARELENVPKKKEAAEPKSGRAAAINVHVHGNKSQVEGFDDNGAKIEEPKKPSRKIARFMTDPATGDRVAVIDEIPQQEEPANVE